MKLFSQLFFYLLPILSVHAQNQPVQLWQSVEYVKSINIKGPTIALDKFQNTYMLTNQTDERPLGGFTLVKYDTLGNLLWKQNSTASFAGIFYGSFTVDSTGNVYVSENYDGGLPGYDADAIFVKYSPTGVKKWVANYGINQTGDSYTYYSELDTLNGRLIILGMNLHDTIPAENFLFVQAVDTIDGSVIWNTKIPGFFRPQNLRIQSDHIQLLSTQYTADGKYFVNTLVDFDGNVTAQFQKPYSGYEIDFNYISRTGDVVFGNRAFGYNVTRVNVQGDTLWAYVEPLNSGTNKNWVRGIYEDSISNVYTTGAIELPGLNAEMVTSKINNNGELEWQDIFHSATGDWGDGGENVSIYNNELIVVGSTQLANSDVVGIINFYNIDNGSNTRSILISNENVFSINKTFGHDSKLFYTSEGYQANINNMVVATGCFSIPKISSHVGNFQYLNFINIYPNPSADYIFISDINTNIFKRLYIYNSNGELISNNNIENTTERITTANLPSGIYTICIYGDNIQISKKVIKI